MAIPRSDTSFFNFHTHSQYSTLDAISTVPLIVNKAHRHGQKFVSLMDHGSMAGWVKLYQACKTLNMNAFPAFEGYMIDPEYAGDWETPTKNLPVGRYHFGLMAINEDGYKALVKFMTMTHTRPRFSKFPRATLSDLLTLGQEHGENLVFTTGCYFGLIQQMIVRGRAGTAKNYLTVLSDAFPNTFVELQHHNICHDDQPIQDMDIVSPMDDGDIIDVLVEFAKELRLPLLAGQDSHYVDHALAPAHTLMKRMVYSSVEDGFPGDSFHLASAEWVAEHYEQDVWDLVEEGFDLLTSLHDVRIAPLDEYIIRVPTVVDNPAELIRERWEEALENLDVPEKLAEQYWDQAEYEDSVINKLNMPTYFYIVEDYVRWCIDQEIAVEARGSANGSLIAFLMGITQTDPIKWGGLFERFLSLDRTKPPDIDLDIEDKERPRLMQYILGKYDSAQIGTYNTLGLSENDDGELTGSIFRVWQTWKRNECEAAAKKQNVARLEAGRTGLGDVKKYAQGMFARMYGDVKSVDDVRLVEPSSYLPLKRLASVNSVYRSYGVHAGGILLSGDDVKISDYIPMMLVASSNTQVTQYDMDDVEAFGLLKMDILGQAPLRMMKLCQQMLIDAGEDIGAENARDFTWIEDDDPQACKLLREGRTDTGIFHYEGYTKAKGGKELGIKSTEDAVMGQALFMPGAMDTKGGTVESQKDLYIARRKSAARRAEITYISPHFEAALKRTYGTVIFQEQIIEVMRNLELDIATINLFFKVVKDSGKGAVERNRARMDSVKAVFNEACRKHGVPEDEAWDLLAGFASYGFNRAHASGYGIRSYRTAYLKAWYPTVFMAALLQTWAGRKKETFYIRESRRIGIRLLPPLINVSGALWTLDPNSDNVIRKGLLSIPGVGEKAALAIEAGMPYDSVRDMVERLDGRSLTGGKNWLKTGEFTGIIGKLHDVGALDDLDMTRDED